MTDYDNQLLRHAIIHARAGEFDIARAYLERALDLADDRETRVQANYWMSQIVTDPDEKRAFLEETLANEPTHPEARRALAIMDGKLKPEEIVNPDALPAISTEPQAAKADRFACPKCGGRMVFAPDGRPSKAQPLSWNRISS
jgi:Flp pilus assembly protein TadD